MSENGQDVTMGNQQERLFFKIGYVLGLIDGEGNLGLRSYRQLNGKTNYSPILQVECTDRKIINQFARYMRDLKLPVYLMEIKARRNYRSSLRFLLKGMKRMKPVLDLLLKYPFAKHKQAEVLKQFINYRKSSDKKYEYGEIEKSLKEKITELNSRGRTESSETIRLTA